MARRKKQREQWSPGEAKAVVEKWRKSGLSGAAFAARHGFSEARLWYWAKRQSKSTEFVAVPIPAAEQQAAAAETGGPGVIELEHRGVKVRVREDLSEESLVRLCAALVRVGRPC